MIAHNDYPKDVKRAVFDWSVSCWVWHWFTEEKKTYREIAQLVKERFNVIVKPESLAKRKRRVEKYLQEKEGDLHEATTNNP